MRKLLVLGFMLWSVLGTTAGQVEMAKKGKGGGKPDDEDLRLAVAGLNVLHRS